jgi:hypothetical protein
MKNRTTEAITPWIAALIAVHVLVGYPAGYILLGEKRAAVLSDGGTLRVFPNELLAKAYYPASIAERWLTGKRVLLGCY